MGEFVTDTSAESMTAAIEANLFGVWTALAALPRIDVYDGSEMIRYVTGVPFPLMNGVMRARFKAKEVDQGVEEALAHFRSRNLPMIWWTGPTTEPADLGSHLIGHGLVHDETETPGMAVDLLTLDENGPATTDFTIERVTDKETYSAYQDIMVAAFAMPGFVGDAFYEIAVGLGFDEDSPWHSYLGRLNGAPVATSMLYVGQGVAGIYNVATLPEARGRGIGAAMTLAPLREAREMGYRIGILQSSQMGLNIYRSLGFQEYCKIGHYAWLPLGNAEPAVTATARR